MDNQNGGDQKGFKYTPNDNGKSVDPTEDPVITDASQKSMEEPLINWSAANAFSTNKRVSWYLILMVITLIVAAVVFLITKDKITTAVIIVSGILIGVYAGKKPKTVNYQLTNNGFTINGRYYQFVNYRSFAIVKQNNAMSAVLTPLKRFVPYSYIFFDQELEDQIAGALSNALPLEGNHKDLLDGFLRKIGF